MEKILSDIVSILQSHNVPADYSAPVVNISSAGIDSIKFLQVIFDVEKHFGLRFTSEQMVPETFETSVTLGECVMSILNSRDG